MTSYTLIGTPFSTFTRTISLGLHYKAIPFIQEATLPHSDLAKINHPFGFIPTLIIKTGADNDLGDEIKLRESQAIARYLDRIKPEPSLQLNEQEVEGGGLAVPEKMWEFVSFVASFGFNAVEVGVVKPRLKAMDDGVEESEIRKVIAPGVETLRSFLSVAESLFTSHKKFAFASRPTWADFFLYPLLSDLSAIPEWDEVASQKVKQWKQDMDGLEAVKNTMGGTLEAGSRP
ncbi:hypothetical protein CVT24_005376 [Panaeolus cyanescens]|uniref:GST N-terminal domain-containing protein n=1 Tax=Panaeolus cyanescens TaxID=181874 RepID=A0A409Y953_9AGAR|nr:hypothetical protein CVT24_005376 [Panaeolus cyanescens]